MAFVKGKSGNPGGRPKAVRAMVEQAQAHTDEAISVLAAGLKDDDARVRLTAANSLLDRGWGKPQQPMSMETPLYDGMSFDELGALILAAREAIGPDLDGDEGAGSTAH